MAILIILVAIVVDRYTTPFNEFDSEARITVKDNRTIGFDTTYSAKDFGSKHSIMHLGILSAGTSSGKGMILTNGPYKSKIVITTEGELSEWLTLSKEKFVLEPFEKTPVEFRINLPEDVEVGNYSSKVYVKFYRTLF